VLLVPSVWPEPSGRVAAEAMINGVPAIVSDRGSLPHVVGGDVADGGGGLVRALPPWMTVDATSLPSEEDVQPWFEGVCRLWDEPEFYALVASRARELAHLRYGEAAARRRHVDYFTSLRPRSTGVVAGLEHVSDTARRVPRSP
jgi:glycosyltransferase involved in cell wall biosynthesis